VVCEIWNAAKRRWLLADPQFDEVWRKALEIDHDVLDVPRDRFWDRQGDRPVLARPELFRLLADAHPGDILLVEQVDRLSRLTAADWERLKAELAARRML
jgi:DNA invertase Pin-like site-specific DNA recombinase